MRQHDKNRDAKSKRRFDTQDREFRFDDDNRRARNYSFLRPDEERDYRRNQETRHRRNNEETYAWDPRQAEASEYNYHAFSGPRSASRARQEFEDFSSSYDEARPAKGVYNYNDRQARPERTGQRGHGPKGYTRKDERIFEDVCERLMEDDRVDARDISVQVNNGVVSLEGTVTSRHDKRVAEDIADTVAGVLDVANRIRVSPRVSESAPPPPSQNASPIIPAPAALASDGDVASQNSTVNTPAFAIGSIPIADEDNDRNRRH